jgi:hypothetical protein
MSASRTASALQDLQRFKSSHSLEDLKSAVYTMFGATSLDALTPENFVTQRRSLVQAYADILKTIEQSYDPTFDPANRNDLPQNCIAPPREAGGHQLPSCADPNDLKDPVARATYAAALQANDLKNKRAIRYQQLKNIDDVAMSNLSATLDLLRSVAPDGTGPDFAALDAILRQVGLSDARRTKIDAMFYARPGI